jgi:hypothetical protein
MVVPADEIVHADQPVRGAEGHEDARDLGLEGKDSLNPGRNRYGPAEVVLDSLALTREEGAG